jgi:hypothetical protein
MKAFLTKEQMEECDACTTWAFGDNPDVKIDNEDVDAMLEWLKDAGYLNEEGEAFAYRFWSFTWHKGELK